MENNTAPNNGKRMATEAELQGNAVIYAALCYVCPLWLIGLLASPEKDSAFVKNHVNCGILLSIAGVASGVIAGILAMIPVVGWILLIVWFCQDSQPGENEFGPNPKEEAF